MWPWPVFGPSAERRLGKPCTAAPLYAAMPVAAQVSASVRPSRPRITWAIGGSVAWKPVATTSTSTGRSTPSAVTTPVGVTRAIGSVTTSTLSAAIAG